MAGAVLRRRTRWPALAAALALGSCEAPPGAQPRNRELAFEPRGLLPTGTHPNGLAVGDFDGDGDPDIVVPALVDARLTVLQNDGTVAAHDATPMPGDPGRGLPGASDALAADLDGDARPELILAMPEQDQLLVLRPRERDDRLDFEVHQAVALARPGYLAAADVDDDGDVDVLLSSSHRSYVAVLRNDGGTLTPLPPVEVPSFPVGLAPVDLDGDRRLDIAVACGIAGRIAVLSGDGRGGFALTHQVETSAWPVSVAAATLDPARGVVLVGATNVGDTLVEAWLRPTLGGGARLVAREQPAGAGAFGIATADLDGDGDTDVAVADKSADTVTIWRNDEGALTAAALLPAGGGPTPIAIADFDGDGRLDLVVANGFSNDAMLYLATPR